MTASKKASPAKKASPVTGASSTAPAVTTPSPAKKAPAKKATPVKAPAKKAVASKSAPAKKAVAKQEEVLDTITGDAVKALIVEAIKTKFNKTLDEFIAAGMAEKKLDMETLHFKHNMKWATNFPMMQKACAKLGITKSLKKVVRVERTVEYAL